MPKTAVFDQLHVCLYPRTQPIVPMRLRSSRPFFENSREVKAGWVVLKNSWAREERVTSQYESVLWNPEVKLPIAPHGFLAAPAPVLLARPAFLEI